MDALILVEAIALSLRSARLEAILIGNAAAALQGAPVTTEDFDFMFRPTVANVRKLKLIAQDFGASLRQPHYPESRMYRIANKEGLQIDMMGVVDGIKSFESLRSHASEISFGDATLMVADLKDVIRSKKQAGRPKDIATLPVLEDTLRLKERR